jgi:SAM-dependent methyltransferase
VTARPLDRPGRFASDRWWTLVAPAYDPSVAIVGWHRWQDALLTDVTCGIVLDLGCGPAHLAKAALARGVDYVGLDRNEAMVARAGRAIRAWGPGRGRVVRADLTAVPFEDASFDVVVATGVLGLLEISVRRVVLREMARVSRGEIRLLEPVARPGEPVHLGRSRILALLRDRPLALEELAEAGLKAEVRGPARLAGVYSVVRASTR